MAGTLFRRPSCCAEARVSLEVVRRGVSPREGLSLPVAAHEDTGTPALPVAGDTACLSPEQMSPGW